MKFLLCPLVLLSTLSLKAMDQNQRIIDGNAAADKIIEQLEVLLLSAQNITAQLNDFERDLLINRLSQVGLDNEKPALPEYKEGPQN